MKTAKEIVESLTGFLKGLVTEDAETAFAFESGKEYPVQCARSGSFVDMSGQKVEFGVADLKDIAARFNTERDHKLKLGHTPIRSDTPDYGDVVRLSYDDAKDRLIAHVVPTPVTVEKNRKEGFRRVSMELDRRSGKFDFGDLALLGARRPAISGLETIAMSGASDDGIYYLSAEGPDDDEEDPPEGHAHFREFTADQRKAAASKGAAMPDGSYPIENESDLKNAIQAFGRAKDPAAVKAHIKKRAKALGKMDLLPDEWGGGAAEDKADKGADESKEMAEGDRKGLDKPSTVLRDEENRRRETEMDDKATARLARLEKQVTDGARDRAKAFLSANVKRIPVVVLKAGLEDKLTAMLAHDATAEEPQTFEFADADGKKAAQTGSKILMAVLESLPEQVTTEETTETTKGGADDKPRSGPAVNHLAVASSEPEGDEYHEATLAEIAAAKADGNVINYEQAAMRVVEKRGSRA